MNRGIAIIGCGNLGLSMLNGILKAPGFSPSDIAVSKRNPERIQHFSEKGVFVSTDNCAIISKKRIIVLAVKPYDVQNVLLQIKDKINVEEQLLVSLATGITISQIQAIVPGAKVFRAMPNTAITIQESITCLSTSLTNDKETSEVKALFDVLGETIFIKEELMESATVLGACGLAYVLRFMRSMVQGGIQIGFDSKTATDIVNQVVKGAASLLIENKQHPETEIDKVTTPKGCTIVGLNEMEHNGFSSSLIKGITASYREIEK